MTRSNSAFQRHPGKGWWAAIPPALVFFAVSYRDGGPQDTYQIPLAIGTDAALDEVLQSHSGSVIAKLATSTGAAILYDAAFGEETHQALLSLIAGNATLPVSDMVTGTNPSVAAPLPTSL